MKFDGNWTKWMQTTFQLGVRAAGIDELEADRLPKLMANKYGTILEGTNALGGIEGARGTFYNFQRSLYQQAI